MVWAAHTSKANTRTQIWIQRVVKSKRCSAATWHCNSHWGVGQPTRHVPTNLNSTNEWKGLKKDCNFVFCDMFGSCSFPSNLSHSLLYLKDVAVCFVPKLSLSYHEWFGHMICFLNWTTAIIKDKWAFITDICIPEYDKYTNKQWFNLFNVFVVHKNV